VNTSITGQGISLLFLGIYNHSLWLA